MMLEKPHKIVHVTSDAGEQFVLKYYVFARSEVGTFTIAIEKNVEKGGDAAATERATAVYRGAQNKRDDFIMRLAAGCVTPVTLKDIVYDEMVGMLEI